ncbi:MAG: hypothetical protein IPN74_11620 [Haliscomenobacter sp.]|nr:hypothetical protein [Haliscomenobacter sp.]
MPSGIAPQLMAMDLACFLGLLEWMILEKISFPTPLSPMISTLKSVEATRSAVRRALSSWTDWPTIPKRCLMD